MGLALVKNYCSVEEETLHTCEIVLNLCADYITEREKAGIPAAELREGLYPLMNGLTDAYGRDMIQIYGKLSHDTGLVSNDPAIESMTDYDVSTAGWHQGAAAADGELYLSPAYIDAASGLPVVTMCRLIPDTGSFLAIDLKPSCFRIDSSHVELPARASYYLTDGEGTLLYYLSSWDYKPEELQVLVNNYRENAVCDTSDHVMENVMASDGIVRNIFFHHMDNGWTGILTIPKDEILSGAHIYRNISILLIGLGIVLVILQGFREYKNQKREDEYLVYQKAMNSTVHACRAIYYINVKTKSCDTVYPLGPSGKPLHSNYDDEVEKRFRYGIVAEEHREQVADFLDMSNIVKRLADREHIELQFRRKKYESIVELVG